MYRGWLRVIVIFFKNDVFFFFLENYKKRNFFKYFKLEIFWLRKFIYLEVYMYYRLLRY